MKSGVPTSCCDIGHRFCAQDEWRQGDTAMIERLTFETNEQALRLLLLQMAAYRVEAELVGFDDIPPLKDTIASIRAAKETFYGYFDGGELAGAVSCEAEGDTVTICRLMVHPDYFRRGIATKLLRRVFELEPGAARYVVSTAALNAPALALYNRNGFQEHGRREIVPGIEIITLVKPNGGGSRPQDQPPGGDPLP
jgi:ribosomal protein S18 acetylase RimI-like enzyme